MSKEVATAAKNEIALDEDMSMVIAGMIDDDMDQDDLSIPRLKLIQNMSPELNKKSPKYNPEAKEGQFVLGDEIFDDLVIVPIKYRRTYIEWKPNPSGKGAGTFIADHGRDTDMSVRSKCIKNEKNQYFLQTNDERNGNELQDTMEYLCGIYDADTGSINPVIFSLVRSQLKYGKKFNGKLKKSAMVNGKMMEVPYCFRAYKVTSFDDGDADTPYVSWDFNEHDFTMNLNNGKEIFAACKAILDQAKAGALKFEGHDDEIAEDEKSDDSPF